MSERRRHSRSDVQGTVHYQGSEGIACTAIADLGLGGIRLLLDGPERPGTAVRLKVRFATAFDAASFAASGMVVWARQSAPYLAGIRWDHDDGGRDRLIDQSLMN